MTPEVAQAASIPDSVYTILGIIILTNLGVIVTVIGAAFRVVYKFAVLETKTNALHRRMDDLQNRKPSSDRDDETNI